MSPRNLVVVCIAVLPLVLLPTGAAFAHGEPIIRADPDIAPAGGTITIIGTEMEPGELFNLALEGATTTQPLGQALVNKGEGEGAGFVLTVTLPADLIPGYYQVRASTAGGESAVADLTVTASSAEANPGPAKVTQPSGEVHVLNRSKPPALIAGFALLAVATASLGVWLVRKRG